MGVIAERESGNYWELLGSSEKQWETANPRYRIFAAGNNFDLAHTQIIYGRRINHKTVRGQENTYCLE